MKYQNRMSWVYSLFVFLLLHIKPALGDDNFEIFRQTFIKKLNENSASHLLTKKRGEDAVTVKKPQYEMVDEILLEIYPQLKSFFYRHPQLFNSVFSTMYTVPIKDLYEYLDILRSTYKKPQESKYESATDQEQTDFGTASNQSSIQHQLHQKYKEISEKYGTYSFNYFSGGSDRRTEYKKLHASDTQPDKTMILFLKDGNFIAVHCKTITFLKDESFMLADCDGCSENPFSRITEVESDFQIERIALQEGIGYMDQCNRTLADDCESCYQSVMLDSYRTAKAQAILHLHDHEAHYVLALLQAARLNYKE